MRRKLQALVPVGERFWPSCGHSLNNANAAAARSGADRLIQRDEVVMVYAVRCTPTCVQVSSTLRHRGAESAVVDSIRVCPVEMTHASSTAAGTAALGAGSR